MNAGTVATGITAVKTVADQILGVVEGLDPAVDVPAEGVEQVIDLTAQLAAAALTAWANASGQPINATTIAALMPNQTALSEPDADTTGGASAAIDG